MGAGMGDLVSKEIITMWDRAHIVLLGVDGDKF